MLDKDVLKGTQSTENGLASKFVQASGQVCMGRRCRAKSKEFFIHKRRMVQSFHLRVDRRVWPNPTWEWFSILGIVLSLRYLSSVITLWVGFSRNRSTYTSSCWAAQTRIDFMLV